EFRSVCPRPTRRRRIARARRRRLQVARRGTRRGTRRRRMSTDDHQRTGSRARTTTRDRVMSYDVARTVHDIEPAAVGNNGWGHLRFASLADWRAVYTAPSWLIRDFMINGAFDVIGGAEKSLKSWMMHHCAIAVASGRPLFGDPAMTVLAPSAVLLLTGEG